MVAESQGSFGVVGSAVGGLIVFGFDGEVGSITVAVGRGAIFGGIGGWWSSLKGDHALFVHCVYFIFHLTGMVLWPHICDHILTSFIAGSVSRAIS